MSKARTLANFVSSGNPLADGSIAASEVTGLSTVATTGAYNDLSGKPSLAAVATSGSYDDLSNKPTITATANDLSGGAIGSIPYQAGTGDTAMLAAGTAGKVLTSNGAAAPSWETPSSLPVGALQYFGGTTTTTYPDPATWLECDGSIYNKSTYTELSTKLGSVIDGLNSGVSYGINPHHGITRGVAYVNSLYFVGGTAPNGLFTSTDTITWTSRTTSVPFQSMAFNGSNRYMFVEPYNGTGYTSTDLVTFTSMASPTYGGFNDIAYGAGLFVGGYIFNQLFTSTDGATWTSRTSNIGSAGGNRYLNTVDFINDYFFVGSNEGYISTSTNGTSWSASGNIPSGGNITGFAFGAGVYVAVSDNGSISSSSNRTTWTAQLNGAGSFYDVIFANNIFVATCDNGKAYRSTDGATWVAYATGGGSTMYSVAYGGNSKWYVSGEYGQLCTSTDAITWTSVGNDSGMLARDGIFDGTNYLSVGGQGSLISSTDNINWTARNTGTSSALYGIAYGASTYAVCGTTSGTIRTSTDTITWTGRTSGTTQALYSLRYLNGIFLAGGGNGVLLTSTDAITWTSRTSGLTANIVGFAYGNGKYIYVNDEGYSGNSTDGVTWTTVQVSASYATYEITFGNGLFVAVGNGGLVATSTDGAGWTPRTSGLSTAINDVRFRNGVFFIGGASGKIGSSLDGISWDIKASAVGTNIFSLIDSPTGFYISSYSAYNLKVPFYSYNTSTQFAVPLQSSTSLSNAAQTLYIKSA